jgi:membrane fusion protein
MKLFRDEAIQFQRSKLLGDVVLYTPPRYSIIIIVVLVLLIISAVFLATQEYRRKERVSGFIMPKGGLTTIIAEQSSYIQNFTVGVGDSVEKGEQLVLLSAGKGLSNGKIASEELILSLDKELEQIDQRVADLRKMHELQKQVYSVGIERLSSDLAILKKSKSVLLRAKDIKISQLSALTEIEKKGFATKRDTNEEELKYLDFQERYNAIEMNIISKQQELNDAKSRTALEILNLSTAIGELDQKREQIFQQKINLAVQQAYTIRSPINGIVTSVFENIGANLTPGRPILTIQPKDGELIARLAVPSRAIGLLSLDQKVLLYYEAFPYQQFGVFAGHITNISLNVINPGQFSGPIAVTDSFYFVDVRLEKNSVFAYGKQIPLLAGMKLDAEVILETNTLIGWLMSPIRAISKKYE